MTNAMPLTVTAPVDSGEHPVSVLLQDTQDLEDTYCDSCGEHTSDWPANEFELRTGSRPGALFAGALYCAECRPCAYSPTAGDLVHTKSGVPVVEAAR